LGFYGWFKQEVGKRGDKAFKAAWDNEREDFPGGGFKTQGGLAKLGRRNYMSYNYWTRGGGEEKKNWPLEPESQGGDTDISALRECLKSKYGKSEKKAPSLDMFGGVLASSWNWLRKVPSTEGKEN